MNTFFFLMFFAGIALSMGSSDKEVFPMIKYAGDLDHPTAQKILVSLGSAYEKCESPGKFLHEFVTQKTDPVEVPRFSDPEVEFMHVNNYRYQRFYLQVLHVAVLRYVDEEKIVLDQERTLALSNAFHAVKEYCESSDRIIVCPTRSYVQDDAVAKYLRIQGEYIRRQLETVVAPSYKLNEDL